MQAFLTIIYCLLFVSVCVLLSLGAHSVFGRWWHKKKQPLNNEFAGIMFGAVSLIYSLIMAFVIVAVWGDYEELNQTVEQETDKLNNIIAHSAMLPDSLKRPIDSALNHYCTLVVGRWQEQDAGSASRASALPKLRLLLLQVQPQGHLQENLLDVLDEDLSSISDLRRERMSHIRSHVPTLVWLMVITASMMLVMFSFFIGTDSLLLGRIGIGFLAALAGMSIFLLYALDHPFTSSMPVSSKPYEQVLQALQKRR